MSKSKTSNFQGALHEVGDLYARELSGLLAQHDQPAESITKMKKGNWLTKCAACLVVAVVVFQMLYINVEAFRVAWMNLFVRQTPTSTDYLYTPALDELKVQGVEFVVNAPDGFALVTVDKLPDSVLLLYQDAEGNSILFEQSGFYMSYSLDNEVVVESVSILSGIEATYFEKEGTVNLYWQHQENHFRICGQITRAQIIDMGNSLRSIDTINGR